ncbi:MAG: integration host factor subunit beta [Gammaproteobacteria bacterium]|jgi:integration host factor subunit beta|nr:integration host factor subunit beta [Gammaproteobacteria bacterium]MDG2267925.1 integration host factor subunit beta [Alphaproteobacteria bacterium]
MTRSELTDLIKEQCPYLENKEVENAIQLFFSEIVTGLTSGKRVELRGFGSFSIKNRPPRIARNPRTGEKIELGSRLLPYFKSGKELNILINS